MKRSNQIGVGGLGLFLLGTSAILFPTCSKEANEIGSTLVFLAYRAYAWAALEGVKKWFFMFLLSPISFMLWIAAQGQ